MVTIMMWFALKPVSSEISESKILKLCPFLWKPIPSIGKEVRIKTDNYVDFISDSGTHSIWIYANLLFAWLFENLPWSKKRVKSYQY